MCWKKRNRRHEFYFQIFFHIRNYTYGHQYKWKTRDELSQPMDGFQKLQHHNNWHVQNMFVRGQNVPKRLPFTRRDYSTNGNVVFIHTRHPFINSSPLDFLQVYAMDLVRQIYFLTDLPAKEKATFGQRR